MSPPNTSEYCCRVCKSSLKVIESLTGSVVQGSGSVVRFGEKDLFALLSLLFTVGVFLETICLGRAGVGGFCFLSTSGRYLSTACRTC